MRSKMSTRLGWRFGLAGGVAVALLGLCGPAPARAQGIAPTGTIEVATGNSHVVRHPVILQRISIANPQVADAIVVSAQEIVINGKTTGTTSLILWDNAGGRALYSVRVTPDLATLEADLEAMFPDDSIEVAAAGTSLVLSGAVSSELKAEKVRALAGLIAPEAESIIDRLEVPEPGQVLLQVRFAEVNRSMLQRTGINILRWNPDELSGFTTAGRPPAFTGDRADVESTLSDAVNLFLFAPDADLAVFIQALKQNGLFRSLAEPNLLAVHGQEASFLAGGEFPYPVVQGGANVGAVTIQFREFGVRLNFTPWITNSGNIRLHVAPEVSTLDFANGLTLQGFNIPAILSRKAETEIELMDGQTFAIAGLIDNTMLEDVDKIPVLGDIPILGALFRSKEMRQSRTELLVLVTPRLVDPLDESPPVPTSEPQDWEWDKHMQAPPSEQF
jgi:pilus assembly protein CpaC